MALKLWNLLGWGGLVIILWAAGAAQADLSEQGELTGTVVDFDTRFVRLKTEGESGQYIKVPRESIVDDAHLRPGSRAVASVKPMQVQVDTEMELLESRKQNKQEPKAEKPSIPANLGGHD